MYDMLIKDGTVVDGTGSPPRRADVAISGGKIVEIGKISATAHRVFQADGATVTPGFVDVHTHFDGQVVWDGELEPSASHGVTSVIMGNCGVGFAPVRPGKEDELIQLMEGVEDIPGSALSEGIVWEWESFPEYLDALGKREYALDIGAQIPHGAIRAYVMGQRGVMNEAATADDIREMSRLVEEGLRAGAVGFSSSRLNGHQSTTGEPVPGTYAAEDELLGIAQGMRRAGSGVFEVIPSGAVGLMSGKADKFTTLEDLETMRKVSVEAGRPVTFSMFQLKESPNEWREELDFAVQAKSTGAQLFPQISSRAPGLLTGFSAYHLFQRRETYMKLVDLPFAARIAEMRKPDVREAILSDKDVPPKSSAAMDNIHLMIRYYLEGLYPLGSPPDYEPAPERSIVNLAAARGVSPEACLYDVLMEQDGNAFCIMFGTNYLSGNFDAVEEMLMHPLSVPGLSDAGAHVRFVCDASMPSFALTHWVRDRNRGNKVPLEWLVMKQCSATARLYDLHDRGTIEVGKRADLNLIDMDRLMVHSPHMIHDLPGGGSRLVQPSTGYLATIVKGVVTRENDSTTGARPGRLIRGGKETLM